jgi:hypothetical protein
MKAPRVSSLSKTVVRHGCELDIVIVESEDGKWYLQVTNELNVSTHWTEPFDTEQAALDEALKAIEADDVDFAAENFPYLLE